MIGEPEHLGVEYRRAPGLGPGHRSAHPVEKRRPGYASEVTEGLVQSTWYGQLVLVKSEADP